MTASVPRYGKWVRIRRESGYPGTGRYPGYPGSLRTSTGIPEYAPRNSPPCAFALGRIGTAQGYSWAFSLEYRDTFVPDSSLQSWHKRVLRGGGMSPVIRNTGSISKIAVTVRPQNKDLDPGTGTSGRRISTDTGSIY
eukprot:1881511-Rhodomonas_salina.1